MWEDMRFLAIASVHAIRKKLASVFVSADGKLDGTPWLLVGRKFTVTILQPHLPQAASDLNPVFENSRHCDQTARTLCANCGLTSRKNYSITSSARASTIGGISRPSARAVGRLMTNSN